MRSLTCLCPFYPISSFRQSRRSHNIRTATLRTLTKVSRLLRSCFLQTVVRIYYDLHLLVSVCLADTIWLSGETATAPLLRGEPNDPGMVAAVSFLRLPRLFQQIYALWVRYVRCDYIFAGLISGFYKKSVTEHFKLVAARETYRAQWHEKWEETGLDFLLTAPNALPAVKHGGMKTGWKVCGYTFLFNLVCNFVTRPSYGESKYTSSN